MARRLAVFVWIGLTLLLSQAPGWSQQPLRIAYPVFEPFHWADEQGAMHGLFYEILAEALERRMKISVTWSAYPWPRCQENLKAGSADAIMTVPTAERAAYSQTHERPFYLKALNLFTYRGHARLAQMQQIETIADIRRGGFSVITYSGNGWNKENLTAAGVTTFESPYLENIWKMLALKRGDLVIEWPPGAWPDIRRLGLEDRILDTGIRIAAMPFHLLIGKGSPHAARLPEFDTVIEAMRRDGSMARILSRY